MSRSKNLTNYHSHSLYCDGRASMEDFVRFALSEGFTSYGFSSHAPLPFFYGMDYGVGPYERLSGRISSDKESMPER